MRKTSVTEMNRLTVEQFRKADKLPLVVILDDVRSLHNVGSVFRTSDAFRVNEIMLCGITATPDTVTDADGKVIKDCSLKASQEIHKTALGAEDSVTWHYYKNAAEAVEDLKKRGFIVLGVEQCHGSTMLNDFCPDKEKKYAVVLGNEVKGVNQNVIDMCDGCLEIPQYGTKHSLNVSVAAGIIIWHFAQMIS